MTMHDLISRAAVLNVLAISPNYHTTLTRIEELPAVDAAPVVHGRWTEKETSENTIDVWQSAKCTNCGKYHTTPYLYYFNNYKFCPNCGAKMDGERRD